MLLDHTSPETSECDEIRGILNRIGDKWSMQVIGALGEEPRRFNELRRNIPGISQRMLTLTVRLLERDGLLKRTVLPTAQPNVVYELTPLGCTIIEPIRAIADWAREHRRRIRLAQLEFDARSG